MVLATSVKAPSKGRLLPTSVREEWEAARSRAVAIARSFVRSQNTTAAEGDRRYHGA